MKSNELKEMVKNLSSAEKAYVVKSFSKNEKNQSELFQKMNKSSKEKFVTTSAENKVRYQLEKSIYSKLEIFHSNSKTSFKIRKQINIVELLIDKGMFDGASKLSNKTIELAEQQEHYASAIQLYNLLIQIKGNNTYSNLDTEYLIEIQNGLEENMFKLKKVNEINALILKEIKLKSFKGEARNRKLKDFLNSKKMKVNLLDDSYPERAKRLFYHLKSYCYGYIGEWEKSKFYSKQILISYESDIENSSILSFYLNAKYNYFIPLIITGKQQEYFKELKQYQKEIAPKLKLKGTLWVSHFLINQFSQVMAFGQFNMLDEGKKIVPETIAAYQKNKKKISKAFRDYIYFYCGLIYFKNREFDIAEEYFEILEEAVSAHGQLNGRLIRIICYYELDKLVFVDHLFGKTKRYFRKVNDEISIDIVALFIAAFRSNNFSLLADLKENQLVDQEIKIWIDKKVSANKS